MKISSILSTNMSNQGCSNEGVDELRSNTSLPVYRDDMESKRKRDTALVKSYDNTSCNTIGRGRRTLKAGILATENLGIQGDTLIKDCLRVNKNIYSLFFKILRLKFQRK